MTADTPSVTAGSKGTVMQANPNRERVSLAAALRRCGFASLRWPFRRTNHKRAPLRAHRTGRGAS